MPPGLAGGGRLGAVQALRTEGAGDGPALGGATGSAGLGGTPGNEPAQPPAGHGHLEPARPGGFVAVQRRSHSRRGFGGHSQQQAEPDSRAEAGLSSGDQHGSLFQRRCPSGTAARGRAQPTHLGHGSAAAVQQESSPAAGVHQGSRVRSPSPASIHTDRGSG